MENIVALLGVLLFWASLIWLPLNIARALRTRGQPQVWTISAILSFFMALMGYTRAIDGGTVMEAFAWSVTWLMPLGLTFFARSHQSVPWRSWDKYLGAVALGTFVLVMPFLPRALNRLSALLWGG
ncbi:hypothetical protein [Tropicimonas sp. S265A]|uniref:hypothetical protein n=1 Tax=Tropicimonas sp. S265A TaxID=3415134 RepID=UPI003C7C8C48